MDDRDGLPGGFHVKLVGGVITHIGMREVAASVAYMSYGPRRSATQEGTRTMPRQARLDAPGTWHHVILRGVARGQLVADAQDRQTFVPRLGEAATATGTTLDAWALLPNHAHLLLRSGPPWRGTS